MGDLFCLKRVPSETLASVRGSCRARGDQTAGRRQPEHGGATNHVELAAASGSIRLSFMPMEKKRHKEYVMNDALAEIAFVSQVHRPIPIHTACMPRNEDDTKERN